MPEQQIFTPNAYEKSLPHHEMVFVEGGEFEMGGSDEEAFDQEKPVHPVRVDSFFMGKYPVTQALWMAVMKGKNPSRFEGENRPVEQVSWNDAQDFIKKLNKETGRKYGLPWEAEWEFAGRGGLYSEEYLYAGSDKLKEVGWYAENSNSETQPVGKLLPNELGFYDLSGNVYEWCEDRYGGTEYYEGCLQKGVVPNPRGPKSGSSRVLRGGSWLSGARSCRVSYRNFNEPGNRDLYFGFRLALAPS